MISDSIIFLQVTTVKDRCHYEEESTGHIGMGRRLNLCESMYGLWYRIFSKRPITVDTDASSDKEWRMQGVNSLVAFVGQQTVRSKKRVCDKK